MKDICIEGGADSVLISLDAKKAFIVSPLVLLLSTLKRCKLVNIPVVTT
jgi:hypothetical protein